MRVVNVFNNMSFSHLTESQLGGDSNSGLNHVASLHLEALTGKDFEWSAARETAATLIKQEANGNCQQDSDEEKLNRKRPFPSQEMDQPDSLSLTGEKRIKKESDGDDTSSHSAQRDDSGEGGIREEISDDETTDSLWTAFDVIKPRIMKSDQLPDLEKFWRPVIESPKDFQAWTSLLQYVDHENDVAAARESYDSFLRRYPYCYGYWKKWADYEKKKAMKKDCEKVRFSSFYNLNLVSRVANKVIIFCN